MAYPRLAILCDFPEENWPSMDLVAEMLIKELQAPPDREIRAHRVCPPFRQRVNRLPLLSGRPGVSNADRLINRLWDYPRYLRPRIGEFDLFHVCDHSYAQLLHTLPVNRTGVFCHDLDAFSCILEPQREARPRWFKMVARHILRGFLKAAVVFHTTSAIRRQIEKHGLFDPARLVQAPLGPAPEFTPEPPDPDPADPLVKTQVRHDPFLLHVGSCIPRKRIDILLEVFAAVRGRYPRLRLVQVGGQFTAEQRVQIETLKIGEDVIQLRGLERSTIAMLCRRAALVCHPSEAEGFGIPIVEALACGSIVVASDIPALREVGGEAVHYCPVGEVDNWTETVCQFLADPAMSPSRECRLARARHFSWKRHAQIILEAYQRLR
jgi:glycosyltransferase involved in cell wall biosynthesis